MMGGTPHVVLLGLRADQDAVAAVREARRLGAPVICAVDTADAAVVRAALDAGADGYLALHVADPDAVRHAVGGALEGQVVVPAELQAPAPRGRPGGGLAVTARGREVLRSLAEGLHDEEVAAQLGISTSSVRKHIATCQERLQARTRTQLVAIAAQSGLL
jgi:DNA-binding NarL/FixJ family response regulator